MTNQKRPLPAFTLIELLVCIAIFGILTVLLAQFLVSFLQMKFNVETLQRIRSEGNHAMDRIDFLIRNGITLPDICQDVTSTGAGGKGLVSWNATSGNQRSGPVMRVNTQGVGSNFFQKSRIAFVPEGPIPTAGRLVLFELSGGTRHNTTPALGSAINLLTTQGSGAVGAALPFNVELIDAATPLFVCSYDDDFGYTVTTRFKITYRRDSFGDTRPISETFFRETAVRNVNPFEN